MPYGYHGRELWERLQPRQTSRLTLLSVCGSGFSRDRTLRVTLFSVCGSGFSRDVSRTGSQLASFFSGMARFAALYFR